MNNQQNISFEKETKQINDEVQHKIANHLWMFCGYNDSIYPAINIDAKYIKAIGDLYNVIIDSSLITRLADIAPPKWRYLKDIVNIREKVNMLRTIGGHTISVENIREDVLYKFRLWEIEQCGTDNPTKTQDFEKLINGLLKVESDCITIVKRFLSDVSSTTTEERNKVIIDWENAIIEYYFKTAHSNMFENKLNEWYATSQPNENITARTNRITLNNAVSNWVMTTIYLKEQAKLDLFLETKRKHYSKLKLDQRDLLDRRIQEKTDKIRSVQDEVANFCGKDRECLTPADYRKHYLSKEVLERKMREVIPEIKNQDLTLLPQDLFGYIIKKDIEKEA